MMINTIILGKDKDGKEWVATVERSEYKSWRLYTFECYDEEEISEPSPRSYGRALVTTEPDNLGKLHLIRVERAKRNTGLGRLLLRQAEEFLAREGVRKVWGDVSNDPDLYEDDFATFEDYIENIRTFYVRQGWTFRVYDHIDPDDPHIIGKVEKTIMSGITNP